MPSASFTPKKLASVSLTSMGLSVTVDTQHVDNLPMAWKITATVGGTVYEETHSIGNAGNTGPTMTLAQLQAALDGYRQKVADAAAWQESMATIAPQLK